MEGVFLPIIGVEIEVEIYGEKIQTAVTGYATDPKVIMNEKLVKLGSHVGSHDSLGNYDSVICMVVHDPIIENDCVLWTRAGWDHWSCRKVKVSVL